jgi:hypothetical protein
MTQKPMLRGEVCARALRLSQSSKDYSLKRVGSIILPAPSKEETVHEIILKPHLSRFCVCYWIEESTLLVAQSVGHAEPGISASPQAGLGCRTEVAAAAVAQCKGGFYLFLIVILSPTGYFVA